MVSPPSVGIAVPPSFTRALLSPTKFGREGATMYFANEQSTILQVTMSLYAHLWYTDCAGRGDNKVLTGHLDIRDAETQTDIWEYGPPQPTAVAA